MYKKILVPLDGSELAECVLPHVESIANGCHVTRVVLARAIDLYIPTASYAYVSAALMEEIESGSRKEALEYLDSVAARLDLKGIEVQKQVLIGRADVVIPEYIEKNGIDYIAIATHGRSGISRWAWGSVADRILRSACVPVMMIRAPGCQPGI